MLASGSSKLTGVTWEHGAGVASSSMGDSEPAVPLKSISHHEWWLLKATSQLVGSSVKEPPPQHSFTA